MPSLMYRQLLTLGLLLHLSLQLSAAEPMPREVSQLLKRHCIKCHGVAKSEGGLQLHTPLRIWKGGQAGPAAVPHELDQSHLWKRVSAGEMPPDGRLDADQQQVLRQWINEGAVGLPRSNSEAETMQQDEHWAFTHLQPQPLPSVSNASVVQTAIDTYVQAELERVGLTLSQEADRPTLIRRVSFCVTGLPPTLEELDSYLQDTRPDAYQRMVERYLASPQFGIRWGGIGWMPLATPIPMDTSMPTPIVRWLSSIATMSSAR